MLCHHQLYRTKLSNLSRDRYPRQHHGSADTPIDPWRVRTDDETRRGRRNQV
jgi:hypothetical protein